MNKENQFRVFRLLIPFIVLAGLLAGINAWAGKHVTQLTGTLEIRSALYLANNHDRKLSDALQYVLRTDDQAYALKFTDTVPSQLRTGQRVKILKGEILSPNQEGVEELMLSAHDIVITKDLSSLEIPTAFGDQKTLVMLVNFQDNPTDMPWTKEQVSQVVFDKLAHMYQEFSYQQTTVSGDLVGWYTIALNRDASCGSIQNTLPSLANKMARDAGVDLSKYQHLIYMFPRNANCSWAGLGTIGGWPSYAWFNGVNNAGVTAHEVGHNLGLYHAHSLECDSGPVQGNCSAVEYGDFSDTMGFPVAYNGPHFNAFQKERLGWLNFNKSPPILTVTESGTYTIDPYETTNGKVKALKIFKDLQAGDSKNYYYLEFRQGIGFDEKMGSCKDCDFTKGVTIHMGNLLNPNSSYILDMSPFDGNKSKMVTLHQGESYTDNKAGENGVTITVDAISENGAVVSIKFGDVPPPVCRHVNPTLTVSSSHGGVVKPGETEFYNVTLWNNDNSLCGASNFALSGTADSHIGLSLQQQYIKVKPGERRDVFLSATVRQTTPPGIYNVSLLASNLADPAYATSSTTRMTVQ